MEKSPLIFDYQSTTPCREEVIEAMRPYWSDFWGNPSSLHRQGLESAEILERSRQQIASNLNTTSNNILKTLLRQMK